MEKTGTILEAELSKLLPVQVKLAAVEKCVQEQIVVDVFRGNKIHAGMLAKELVVIRHVSKLVSDLKIMYETLILRIGAIKDHQELLNVISPAVSSLKELQMDIARVMPAARETFSSLSDMFSSTLVTLNIVNGSTPSRKETSDALDILDEASRVVEEQLKQKFPTLPEIKPKQGLPV